MCIFPFFLRIALLRRHRSRLLNSLSVCYIINNKWETDTSIQLFIYIKNATGIAIYLLVLMVGNTGNEIIEKKKMTQRKMCAEEKVLLIINEVYASFIELM